MNYFTLHLKDSFPFLGEAGADPRLHCYLPSNMDLDHCREAKRPCLVVLPGGGYSRISPRESESLVLHFLSLGYHTFILEYTPGPEHTFPTQLREVAAVLELLHANTDTWLCDADKVAIMGFSAGGHLAAHYANAYDWPQIRQVFPNSHPVQACVLAYAVITADPALSAHIASFRNLLGHTPSQKEAERFSCQNMVTDRTPPTFLWHTAADQLVPVANSLLYAQALSEHAVPFELHIFPQGKHGLSHVQHDPAKTIPSEAFPNRQWIPLCHSWLRRTFSPEQA